MRHTGRSLTALSGAINPRLLGGRPFCATSALFSSVFETGLNGSCPRSATGVDDRSGYGDQSGDNSVFEGFHSGLVFEEFLNHIFLLGRFVNHRAMTVPRKLLGNRRGKLTVGVHWRALAAN